DASRSGAEPSRASAAVGSGIAPHRRSQVAHLRSRLEELVADPERDLEARQLRELRQDRVPPAADREVPFLRTADEIDATVAVLLVRYRHRAAVSARKQLEQIERADVRIAVRVLEGRR